jgi:nucleoside-diphosphate-sugar epimerase
VKLLVTGATGLIGSHACARLLDAGHALRALVREPAKLVRVLAPFPGAATRVEPCAGDVTDPRSVAAALAGCGGLLHCAGLFSHALGDAETLRRTNVEGTRVVLEAAAAAGLARIVHVSSMLALSPRGSRLRPDDPVASPRALYAATKAAAEHVARGVGARGAPLTIVYPASVHGPDDPSVGSGPDFVARALREGRVLVCPGGLAWTDVRDLAALLAGLFAPGPQPARLMAPSFFLSHARFHALLCELTGRELRAQRLPGFALRALGRLGDLGQRWLGRPAALTHEAALVLTRSVPLDDAEARARLGRAPAPPEPSFRDLLVWLHGAGVLEAYHVGRLAQRRGDRP